MSCALTAGRALMTADEAAAQAVVLARVQAIASYPITPQTIIVERLAELVAGRDDVEYANLESEHSMFGWAIAASHAGVRTFTATSSQGLLYAHEQLHRASRERVPLVAVNVNRSTIRAVEPGARSLRQHEPARHRLDPALLLPVRRSWTRSSRLPAGRDASSCPVMVSPGLRALAHDERTEFPARSARRVPAAARPSGSMAARPGATARLLGVARSRKDSAAFPAGGNRRRLDRARRHSSRSPPPSSSDRFGHARQVHSNWPPAGRRRRRP